MILTLVLHGLPGLSSITLADHEELMFPQGMRNEKVNNWLIKLKKKNKEKNTLFQMCPYLDFFNEINSFDKSLYNYPIFITSGYFPRTNISILLFLSQSLTSLIMNDSQLLNVYLILKIAKIKISYKNNIRHILKCNRIQLVFLSHLYFINSSLN